MGELTDARPADAMATTLQRYPHVLSAPSRRLQLVVKQILDLVVASLALVIVSPLVALLAFLIRCESPGPPVFSQRRLGRGGQVFAICKLRSMVDGAPMVLNAVGSTRVVDDDSRAMRLGARLRARGLDELPQLVNVLKGDVSLIGPRPDHDFQLQCFADAYYRKLATRPGITSLAQVSGRNALPWRERTALEIEHVERFSLWLDLQIFWRTVGVVLRGRGVNNPTSAVESDGRATVLDSDRAGNHRDG